MITLRRARVAVLAVPVLLGGCSDDAVEGTGVFPSASVPTTDFPTSATVPDPTGTSSSASPTGASGSALGGGYLARFTNLTGSASGVILDPGFLRALTALGVTPAVVGTTRLSERILSFPITGGNATVYTPGSAVPLIGSVQHDGSGLSLSAKGTTVGLTNFLFLLGPTSYAGGMVTVNGKTAASGARLFDLDTRAALVTGTSSTATVGGLTVTVSSSLAALLNQTFGTTAFSSSLVVGEAALSLTGR